MCQILRDVVSEFMLSDQFYVFNDLRISVGDVLVLGLVVDLAHGFDDGLFSDMLPGLCEIRGDGNQLFLKSWTRPRNV